VRELHQIEIENKIEISFLWKDPTPGRRNLGRAEFEVCLRYLRGKIQEFWVCPAQQRRDECWHLETNGSQDFSISSYDGLENAKVWLFSYCKTHKASHFRLYVPSFSNTLKIDHYGLSFYRR
jgi:hypothetical protein